MEYGSFKIREPIERSISAHRFAYYYSHGFAIPPLSKSGRGDMICHKCDNPVCCNPNHLYLGNIKTNTQDCVLRGRILKGENHPNSKLTEKEVLWIRKNLMSSRKAAKKLGIGPLAVQRIRNGITWKHLPLL